jgi:hypothetical protein
VELIDRAGELCGAGLQLSEQADVLDGDHRLVGEGLEQRDLLAGEGPDDSPRHRNGAQRPALQDHRDGENRSKRTEGGGQLRILADICDLNDGGREDRPGRHAAVARRLGESPLGCIDLFGRAAVVSDEVDQIPVESKQMGVVSFAQGGRRSDDGVEGWLSTRRRARDHPQDLGGGGLLLQSFGEVPVARL